MPHVINCWFFFKKNPNREYLSISLKMSKITRQWQHMVVTIPHLSIMSNVAISQLGRWHSWSMDQVEWSKHRGIEFLDTFGGRNCSRNQVPALLSRYLVIPAHSRCFPFRNWGRKSSRELKKRHFLGGESAYSHPWSNRHLRVWTHVLLLTFFWRRSS